MSSEKYGRLTEAQRDTLRLYLHLQIKEIAQELGIAESTVNQRLTQCRRILGTLNSRAAAKWLVRYEEQNGLYSLSSYQFSTMASQPATPSTGAATVTGTDDGAADDNRVDSREPALPVTVEPSDRLIPWPFKTRAAPDNRLSTWARIALVLPVAACLLAAAMMLALLCIGFQDVLVSLQHLFISGS